MGCKCTFSVMIWSIQSTVSLYGNMQIVDLVRDQRERERKKDFTQFSAFRQIKLNAESTIQKEILKINIHRKRFTAFIQQEFNQKDSPKKNEIEMLWKIMQDHNQLHVQNIQNIKSSNEKEIAWFLKEIENKKNEKKKISASSFAEIHKK